MMYPFMTLADETEITHSEYLPNGMVKIHVEQPNEKDCFHYFDCFLPGYEIKNVYGFQAEEVEKYVSIIKSTAHLIMEFSKGGGFEYAANF